jgi:hypothetical protein
VQCMFSVFQKQVNNIFSIYFFHTSWIHGCHRCEWFSLCLWQAESGADQKDWIQKITGVIASLLNSPFPQQVWCSLFWCII